MGIRNANFRSRRRAIRSLPLTRPTRESALVVRSLVANNIRYKLASTEPLDRAIDFLSLGRILSEKAICRWQLFLLRKRQLR